MPKGLREAFESEKCALSLSSFQCAFSVDTEWFGVSDTHTFTTEPFEAGTQIYDRLCVKNYRQYGKHIAPAGNTVVQCSLIQYGVDAEFWSSLRESDHQAYKKKKEEQAAEIENRIIARFPQLEGKLHLLDVWTPASYMSRFNSYKGAYMRFLTSAINHNASIPNKVKGIQNVYLAGQWLQYPGGIPTAALSGKKVIERIKSKK